MNFSDHVQAGAGQGRIFCVPLLLVCLFLWPTETYGRQSATAAAAPQTAPRAPEARPAQAPAEQAVRVEAIPRAPQTTVRAAPPRTAEAHTPIPPRNVVTVVHRLSGWKLLAWLASNGPPTLELDELPSRMDAHTKIVAGYIYDDGRSVVARLPQAEVELESIPVSAAPPGLFAAGVAGRDPEPEYMLVTLDGRRVEAKFVGLDSSTGLTLLEAKEPLLKAEPFGDQGDTDDPAVGQRVRLYAPAPAVAPAAASKTQQRVDAGYIHLSIDQREGLLTHVRRAPSGKPSRVVVSASVSPAWTGAVAANDLGEVVGIVSQTREGETQILPMATVRGACERVLKLRGTAPQPWLGARGDAASQASLDAWVSFGWRPEMAIPHIEKRQGVFLTSVAPGTPAALAGLKAGDLIAGVGARQVRSAEDLSLTLKEAGVGSKVDLTVWRAMEPAPFKVSVELKGANNPALATAEAEEKALRFAVLGARSEISEMRAFERRLKGEAGVADARELALLSTRLAAAEQRLARLTEQLNFARTKVTASRTFSPEAAPLRMSAQAGAIAATTRLQMFGLHIIGLSPRSAARLGAKAGLLVVAVRPESPASASGLVAGDVIETINDATYAPPLLSVPDNTPLKLGLVREGRRLSVNLSPSLLNEQ